MTKEELWQAVLAQVQFNMSPANFATWFKNTKILDKTGEKVIVSVPNNFSKEWLENKYNKSILKILRDLDQEIKEIKYDIAKTVLETKKEIPQQNVFNENQLDFQEFKINKETNLNPRYIFENFVVGSFNELPHAAAQAICKKPGLVYNPLFVYGGVGLGKTHLIQAIGNEVNKKFPKKRIKYISSEKFISGVVNSIREHNIENFKNDFKKTDVLIIDDIQFLAGKEKTQEEFFHIFNTLYQNNKQMIISSDRLPKAIPSMEERLRSRFEGGMIVDVGIPDIETRIAILKVKTKERKIDLSDEVLEYVAENIQKNIRELEGAINKIAIHKKISNQDIDLNVIKKILKNIILAPQKPINPKKIITIVANFYDLKEKDLFLSTRKKEIVKPRQIAMYLLRDLLKCSFPFIGRKFQGKDHTTTIYACSKISKEIQENETLNEEINIIKQRLYYQS
ncbi:chromosomal replication initiator protein DnaA [Candidatus Parcubacteria bacterium]|nr:chromosomal replication initiator protein DnaA [Candidatus Parcubacteria bacterium]